MNQTNTGNFTNTKKLYLSDMDKKIAGVCGGIAEYFNIDATLVRIIWVVLSIMSGLVPGVIGYVVAVMVIPRQVDPQSGSEA